MSNIDEKIAEKISFINHQQKKAQSSSKYYLLSPPPKKNPGISSKNRKKAQFSPKHRKKEIEREICKDSQKYVLQEKIAKNFVKGWSVRCRKLAATK